MTHREGNVLIAKFEGLRYIEDGDSVYDGKVAICVDNLEYHSSWNALMPVVEKIESIDLPRGCFYEVLIANDYCSIKVKSEQDFFFVETNAFQCKNKIDAVWQTVVKFIQATQK